jgi:RNA polymerase sigma factor (sigma-70 family)
LKHSLPTFDRIVEEEKWLIHYCMKQLHIYKQQDEYYQEGLIGLWEAYQRFDEGFGVAFRTYAWRMIRGKMLTLLRRSKRHEDRQVTLSEAMIEIIEDPKLPMPLENEIMMDYCAGLTDAQKKWVILHFIEGKGQNQIALDENVSLETVKSWRRYALQKMRKGQAPCPS